MTTPTIEFFATLAAIGTEPAIVRIELLGVGIQSPLVQTIRPVVQASAGDAPSEAAVAAALSTRDGAISAETAARQLADQTETSERQSADSGLATAINTQAGRITQEVSDRQGADQAVQAAAAQVAAAQVAAIGTTISLGNISGAVSLELTPNTTHTATLTGNLTSWTFSGLASGQTARVILITSGYSVATTGLSAYNGISSALTNIAVTGIVIHIFRAGGTYYAIC